MLNFIRKPWVLLSMFAVVVAALFFGVRPSMMGGDYTMDSKMLVDHSDLHNQLLKKIEEENATYKSPEEQDADEVAKEVEKQLKQKFNLK